MLFDYDNETKINEIKEDHLNICKLQNSLSEHRSKFRNFSEEVELDFSVLDECIKRYQNSLLISCYTFSEQITKNLIYELIGKDNTSNNYLNNYLNKKINPDKFSPNVKSSELLKIVRELDEDFSFILNNHEDFNRYDEMVRCRHLYAHANNYTFQFEQFDKVINVLEYINYEFTLLARDEELRKKISTLYKDIKRLAKSLCNGHTKSIQNPKLQEFKTSCEEFCSLIGDTDASIQLFDRFVGYINEFLTMDIEKESNCVEIYNKLNDINDVI